MKSMVYYRRKKKSIKFLSLRTLKKRVGIKNKINKNVNKQKRNHVDNKKPLLTVICTKLVN